MRYVLAAGLGAVALAMAGSASALTFVNIATSQGTGTDQISWTAAATGGGTLKISGLRTRLNFDDSVFSDGAGLDAVLDFTGTSAANAGNLMLFGPNFVQQELVGSFRFRSLDHSITYLAGTFSHYWLQGTVGSAGSGNVTSSIGTANFTSDLVDLSYVLDDNFQFGFTNVHRPFNVTGGTLRNFKANNVSGSFGGLAVPEPASWALMISGFGAAGAMLRRRRNAHAAI